MNLRQGVCRCGHRQRPHRPPPQTPRERSTSAPMARSACATSISAWCSAIRNWTYSKRQSAPAPFPPSSWPPSGARPPPAPIAHRPAWTRSSEPTPTDAWPATPTTSLSAWQTTIISSGWHRELIKTAVQVAAFLLATLTMTGLVLHAWRCREADLIRIAGKEREFRTLLDTAPDAIVIVD